MRFVLYGDGKQDDYPAIQELLDSGASEVVLPAPVKNYTIGKTLKIHGGQTLRLGATTLIRLSKAANCSMIEDCDFGSWKSDITIDGGIWDMNHREQDPNPWHFAGADGKTAHDKLGSDQVCFAEFSKNFTTLPDVYTGFCMRFCRVRRFTLKNITLCNPVTYGVQLADAENFTVENVNFDYTEGSPKKWNMDGIHIEGGCRNGVIKNLKGVTHDDMVAFTADDGFYGPIRNMLLDGVFADGAHSAVRILSHGLPVENIVIRNIFGKFYSKCVGITKYHGGENERGIVRNVTITDVNASVCEGTEDVKPADPRLFWIQKGIDAENIILERICREETYSDSALLLVEDGATVKGLTLRDVKQKNLKGGKVKFLEIHGKVSDLVKERVYEE